MGDVGESGTPNTVWALPAPCEFAGQVISERLGRMLAHAEGVRQAENPEAVHQMRVWSRRTRAALDLFESCFEEKGFRRVEREVRAVTRALGQARDLDVMIEALEKRAAGLAPGEQSGVTDYIMHLRSERAAAQDAVVESVSHLEERDLPRRFAELAALPAEAELKEKDRRRRGRRGSKDDKKPKQPETLLAFAATRIEARLNAVVEYVPYLAQPEAVFELHEMRIAAKRLRYTLEIFEPVYETHTAHGKMFKEFIGSVRDVQEHLGHIHDADVLIPQLTGYLARMLRAGYGVTPKGDPVVGVHRVDFAACAGMVALCRERQAERDQEFVELKRTWDRLQSTGAFEGLRAILHPKEQASAEPTPGKEEALTDGEPDANGAKPRRTRRAARVDAGK